MIFHVLYTKFDTQFRVHIFDVLYPILALNLDYTFDGGGEPEGVLGFCEKEKKRHRHG